MQEIIVIVIVLLAIAGMVWYYKRKNNRPKSGCHRGDCSGCDGCNV